MCLAEMLTGQTFSFTKVIRKGLFLAHITIGAIGSAFLVGFPGCNRGVEIENEF